MSDTVNTGFILDMQRKLYRWSAADPDKRFADLFNIVCDRRTLFRAWQRLARNRGSNTPGTDRVTRKKVEERPDGVAGFLEDIQQDRYAKELTNPSLFGSGSSRSRASRGSSAHWAFPRSKTDWSKWRSSWCWNRSSRRTSIRPRTAFGPAEAPMTHSQECGTG